MALDNHPLLPPPPLKNPTLKGGEGSLTEKLLTTTAAAAKRNEEATLMFQNISCIIDDAASDEHLPSHLQTTFREFLADLHAVALCHFECHVNNLPKPPRPYRTEANTVVQPISPSNTRKEAISGPALTLPKKPPVSRTFAAVSASVPAHHKQQQPKQLQQQSKQKMVLARSPTKNEKEDNRLLVRVSPGHPCLDMSPYAIMMQINQFLNEKLVREIQITKTGFAICPTSVPAQELLLNRMADLEIFLSTKGICKVEKPTNHIAYLLSGIPRSYTGFNGTSLESVEITAQIISEALRDLTNFTPISIIETRGRDTSQYLANKDWVVLYPEGSSLSKSLPLFGVRVNARRLPKRTKIPQCGKCFAWHNERACIKSPRCRICGSTQHLESGHTSCNPDRIHSCPPRCANCHGPHTADSLECLIRPSKDHKMPSKAEIAKIRQAASAARIRLKIAHCDPISSKNGVQTTIESDLDMNAHPETPKNVQSLFCESPTTSHGRFTPLETLTNDNSGTSTSKILA